MPVVLTVNFKLQCSLRVNCVQIWFGVSTDCFPCNQADSCHQLNYHVHTLFATTSLISGHEKTRETRNDIKICNLTKGLGTKSEKYGNWVGIK